MLRTGVPSGQAFNRIPELKKNIRQVCICLFLLSCIPVSLHAQPPAIFEVTGGGSYCEGTAGMPVGLAGSESEVTYSLIKDGVATSISLTGTGSALDFGNQTAGIYTIEGKNAEATVEMKGSASVTLNPTPPAPEGSGNQSFCTGNLPTVADLVAIGSEIRWYDAPSGGTMLSPETPLVHNTRYYASQTVNGCESTLRLNVRALLTASPSAPSGASSQVFCTGISPVVSNLVASGTDIKWYDAATGGTQYLPTDPLVSSNHYFASQTVNNCESPTRLDVLVTINETPSSPTGSTTQTFCSGSLPTVAILQATGTAIKWYPTAAGGSPLASNTALINGTHYYASQTVNGCESTSRLDVTVIVNTTPAAPTGNATQTFCSSSVNTVANLVASGTSIQWYSNATEGSPLPLSTVLVNGTHYYASQTVNGCESTSRLNVTVVILTTPVVAPQTAAIMSGQTFTVTPSGVPMGTTYTWTAPSVMPLELTGGTAQPVPQTSITGTLYLSSGAGSAIYTVTPHNGICTGNTFTVTVIVTSSCVAATLINQPDNAMMCSRASASFTVAVNGTSPITYRWQYYNGTSWVNTANNTPAGAVYTGGTSATLNVSGITVSGNFQYRCSVTNCTTEIIMTNTTVLTVNPLPSNPVIGSVVHPTCTVATGTITISAPAEAGMSYSLNGTDYTNTSGVFSNVPAGSYTVTARSSSGCISNGTAVTINAQPATPVAPVITLIQPSCAVATGTITVTAPTGTGMTYSINGSTYTASNVFTAVTSGTYAVTARSSAGCTSPGTIANLNLQPPTPVVEITNPAPVCSPNTINLTTPDITAGSTSGLIFTYWTNAQATIAYATPSAAVNGTYYIKGTNSYGCYDVKPVTVTVIQTPAANAGTGGNECDLNFQLNATSTAGTGTWTLTSGPGTATFSPSANNPRAIVTVSEYGTYTFTWTEVNGICSNSNSVTVNFYEQPVANAGTGGNNCGLSFLLNGSMNVGTGVWTRVSGPGTATFSPSTSDPGATVTVTAYGSHVFRWTVTNGTCTNHASISVNFVQQPAADAGNGGDECDLDFTLNALPASAGTWSKLSGPGDAVFSNPVQPNSTVTVSMPGIYDFAWTIQNVTCKSSDVVTVHFHDLPQVTVGADITICEGDRAFLQASGTGTFRWEPDYAISDPDVSNPIATPLTTTVYTVRITDQFGCTNSDDVTVTVGPKPVANAGPDQVLEFIMETNLSAAPVLSGIGTWSVIAGAGNIEDVNDPHSGVTRLAVGFNEFRWTVDNGICPPVNDDVIIRVNDLVIPTLITPDHGDTYNEYFVIRGLQSLSGTSLTVFDRRGMRVFENLNYNNDWNGVDQNNTDLAEDTYYYILKTQNGRSYKGFVVIRR